jgi:hypothetical protein
MGWAAFWEIFSQTRLVTLLTADFLQHRNRLHVVDVQHQQADAPLSAPPSQHHQRARGQQRRPRRPGA